MREAHPSTSTPAGWTQRHARVGSPMALWRSCLLAGVTTGVAACSSGAPGVQEGTGAGAGQPPASDASASGDAGAGGTGAGNDGGRAEGSASPEGGASSGGSGSSSGGGGTKDAGALEAAPAPEGGASTNGGGTLCPSLGWCDITDTKMAEVCPDPSTHPAIQGDTGCSAVIDAWNSGVADTTRNRLVIWGGGHHDYWGNEVYALDLVALKMVRLNDPSDVTGLDFDTQAYEALPDGKPSARHTYSGLTYVPTEDLLFSYGGVQSGPGTFSDSTWTLALSSLTWTETAPNGPADYEFGEIAAYDPSSSKVLLLDPYDIAEGHLWSYDPSTKEYALLASYDDQSATDGYEAGVLDTDRHLLFAAGSGMFLKIDVSSGSSYAIEDLSATATGCGAMIGNAYPGLAYDTKQKLVVAWNGGDAVTLYDPDKNACTSATYGGGPGAAAPGGAGVFGHFQYFPSLNVFAVVNDWQEDAYTLRLTN